MIHDGSYSNYTNPVPEIKILRSPCGQLDKFTNNVCDKLKLMHMIQF